MVSGIPNAGTGDLLAAQTNMGTEFSRNIGPRVFVSVTTDCSTAHNFATTGPGGGVVFSGYIHPSNLIPTPVQTSTESEFFVLGGFIATAQQVD